MSGESSILLQEDRHLISSTEGTAERKQHLQYSVLDTEAPGYVDKEIGDAVAEGEEKLSSDHVAIIEDFILESLIFSAMKDREEQVIEAHTNTFDWLFSESKHDGSAAHFSTWLRGKDSIFWVNGKAGSGKSTLMRFIGGHKKTVKNLQVWAGEKKLTTAGFYFWTSGSLEQRSQVGLLRYLLYQLLQEHRHLIRITFPRIWKHYIHSSTKERIKAKITWELKELMEGFNLFLQRALVRVKICLFIDGLDEFEGDHEEIINLFKALPNISDGNLKICLSSRPWSTFERAFLSCPTFRLQELTFFDMVEYVTDKFREDPRLRKMLQDGALETRKLVTEIVKRANGVFLWVTLVVRSLISDLEDSDRIIDVERRLHALPTNLDQLFQHTLFDIQPVFSLEQASQVIQLIRAREMVCDFTGDMTSTSLTLWELALALEKDMKLATDTEIHQGSDDETLGRCHDAQSLIQNSCAGLIRINPPTRHNLREIEVIDRSSTLSANFKLLKSKITYLHRTVRDFLIHPSSSAWPNLVEHTPPTFNPHIQHLTSFILQLKLSLRPPNPTRNLDDFWPGVLLSLTHARFSQSCLSSTSTSIQNSLLNTLNTTLNRSWRSRGPHDTWSRATFSSYEKRNRAPIPHPFLALCTKFGLTSFLSSTLSSPLPAEEEGQGGEGKPLLSYALEFLTSRQLTIYPLSSPVLVHTLLQAHGAGNPNQRYRNFAGKEESAWFLALRHLRDADRRGWIKYYDVEDEGVVRWVKIMKMLLQEGGADPNAVIVADKWDPEASALEIVEQISDKYSSLEIRGLRDLMLELGAKRRPEG
ncbi:MAG: hypothetical protein LQ342_007841 [Letrouitia transgressa]|nr:MAG: hypothetical protein LQ342_007841 [Letrouitia transgressa]